MPPLPRLPGLPTPTGAPSGAPAPTPQASGVPSGLDPKAFILTKAIAYQENGGKTPSYTVKGKSGEFGAYQYIPDTWNARAAKYLGPNAPSIQEATPDQQNQVTYSWVADKLSQGFTPAQIASMHNAGEGAPNAYLGNAGTNKSGVNYDTKAYANGVQKYAEQLYAGINPAVAAGPTTADTGSSGPTPPPSMLGSLGTQAQGLWDSVSQSKPTDSPLVAGGKAALNMVPSAFNFAKNAISTLNPLTTLGNIASIPKAFNDAVGANGGDVGKTLGYAFGAAPGEAYNAAVPEATRDVIGAGIGFAQHPDQIMPTLQNLGNGPAVPTQNVPGIDDNIAAASKSVTNDPFGQTAPLVFAADAGAGAVDAATGAAARARMGSYVENIGENTAKGVPIPRATGTDLQGAFRGAVEKVASPVTGAAGSVFGRGAAATAEGGAVPAPKAQEAAGKIVQGSPEDQATAARVLSQVDTKGVKTYEDLSGALQKSIDANQSKVDAAHAENTTPVKLKDLTQTKTSEAGGIKASAKINYVQTALTHLQELYSKTADPAALAQIRALAQKAKTTGLTSSEINMLARKYGTEFGTKAFSKRTGDALTSVNAQAYENVRSGLKDTARGLLTDSAAKTLDKSTSEMIRVKGLVDTMAKKVNSLEQRVVRRNIVEKIARGVGSAIDFATFGGPKAFVQKLFFPSNVGLKTMNSIDLENQLRANLKTIRGIENADDTTFANGIIRAARAVNALPTSRVALPSTVFGRAQATASGQ